MTRQLIERVRGSLSAKITLMILLPAAAIAMVHAIQGYLRARDRATQMLQTHGAIILAKYLSAYVEHQMAQHRGDDLSLLLDGIIGLEEVKNVRLMDAEGTIKISGSTGEVGSRVDLSERIMRPGFDSDAVPHVAFVSFTNKVLTIRRELPNKPECTTCHSLDKPINGYLEISIAPDDVAILLRSQWWRQVLTGLVLLTVLCVVSIWLVRWLILRRISRISYVVKQVEAGSLNVRTGDNSPDEIGRFSQRFDLMIAELEESRKKLEKAHKLELMHFDRLATIGELSSGLAHEIRNPLAGISAALQRLLKSKDLSPGNLRIINEVYRQVTRLDETTRKLLAFARPEAPSLQEIDANELVRRFVPVINGLIGGKDKTAEIELDLARDLLPIKADPKLLHQVLINLVLNGLHAQKEKSASQKPRIVIKTYRGRQEAVGSCTHESESRPVADFAGAAVVSRCPNGFVRIAVRDFGIGLSPEVQQAMFKPFFTTKEGGTGLGLSVSRRIVTDHGGCLFGRNVDGEGAEFVICLPVRGSPPDSAPHPTDHDEE